MFRFEKEVPANIQLTYPIMVVTFKKPVAIAVDRLNRRRADYISAARLDPDGMAIRIALAHKVKFNSIPAAERLYVDLLPETWTGMLPGLPQEVIEELANRALDAERQLRLQRLSAKTAEAAGDPRQGRDPADLHALRVRDAGRGECRARTRRRQADARIRPADQMGSGGRQGGHAADAAIDRRRRR